MRLAACALLLAACSDPVARTRLEALSQTREAVRSMVERGAAPGISYVQVDRDGTVLEVHAGVMDVAGPRPVSARTQFMGYSTAKALTAIAVMQLVAEGRIALDAPLARYVPDQPYGDAITVSMLLAHTAGVPNPIPSDWFFVEGDAVDRDAALRRVLAENDTLASTPGEDYRYSNVGYWLLEKVIESASGRSYVEYLRAHVLAPLGIDDEALSFELPPRDVLATGHIGQWSPMNLVFHFMAPSRYWIDARHGWSRFARLQSLGLGYGGAYTTTRAWAAILRDLLRPDGTLLDEASKRRMFARQSTREGEPVDGTLGFVTGELHGVPYVGKQGGGLGFHGNLRLYPSLGLATVYFANTTEVSPSPIDDRSDDFDAPMVRWLAK